MRPIAEAVMDVLTRSVAGSTNKTYSLAWREWIVFCQVRQEDPILATGQTELSRRDEDRLLQFCVYLADTLSRAAGTVKNKVMGVRHVHVVNGSRSSPRVAAAKEPHMTRKSRNYCHKNMRQDK